MVNPKQIEAVRQGLRSAYQSYDEAFTPYRSQAACRSGCAYCCTHYGRVDITTQEGWRIAEWLRDRPNVLKQRLNRRLAVNLKAQIHGEASDCPFLDKRHQCRIYRLRPFSCRQLYSVRQCGPEPPVMHRSMVALARMTVQEIQRLDPKGYSGHISAVLHLLAQRRFRKQYLAGEFAPQEIREFGRTHGLVVNCVVSPPLSSSGPATANRHDT
jgi:hypothetical protein